MLAAANVIVPPPVLESTTALVDKVIGLVPVKLIAAFPAAAFVVLTVLAKNTAPDPFCVKLPFEENVFSKVVVRVPLLVSVMGPLPVVVTFSKKVKFAPVREIPPLPSVFKAPWKRVVPVPAD